MDASIILGSTPLPSPAEMQDQRTARDIQQQEVELRRQEILARRDALREQARLRSMPQAPDPAKQKQALEYNIFRGQVVADALEKAKANPDLYPHVRQWIGQTVGQDALSDLPETYDQTALDGLIATGHAHLKATADKLQLITTMKDGQPVQQFVAPAEGASYPVLPKAETGTVRTREIETIENGRRVRKIVEDVPGQSFQVPAPTGGGSSEPLQAIIGPGGKPVLVTRSQAVGKTPATAATTGGARATGAQNKVLGFFNRAKQADEDLQNLEASIAKMGYLDQERMKRAPNLLQTQLGQSYNQAQRAFTEARLRKDSGAAIPDSEFANDRRTYFAQPGDTPDTLAQKARARAAVLASLAFESGAALEGFYGDDATQMITDYKARSAKAKADPLGIR